MLLNLDEIPQGWREGGVLPAPDWKAVRAWLDGHVPPDQRPDAYREAAMQWLEAVARRIGGNCQVHDSPNFLILADETEENALRLLRFSEHLLAGLRKLLGPLAWADPVGPHVILAIHDADLYHAYASRDLPEEGEFGASAGITLRTDGYIHVALHHVDMARTEGIIRHEMVHVLLSERALPGWLEEGMVVTMDRMLSGRGEPHMDERTVTLHERFWTPDTIQDFWSGRAFYGANQAAPLAYGLAEVLVDIMMSDGDNFPAFVADAHFADAGAEAAEEHLGASLGAFVEEFLGPGEWDPRPPAAADGTD